MNAHRDPDRLIHAFLMEGQTELADPVYDAVRSVIEQKRQRARFGPWRTPIMNKLVPIGLGVGRRGRGPRHRHPASRCPSAGGVGGGPSASRRPCPRRRRVPRPTASPAASPPPLTETFTSQMHGISVSYPEGWIARAATEPWTGTGGPNFIDPFADLLIDPAETEHLFLLLGSQPIGTSTPDEWVAETMAAADCSGYRADRRGRRHRTDRGQACDDCRRHNRWSRLLDPALYDL